MLPVSAARAACAVLDHLHPHGLAGHGQGDGFRGHLGIAQRLQASQLLLADGATLQVLHHLGRRFIGSGELEFKEQMLAVDASLDLSF